MAADGWTTKQGVVLTRGHLEDRMIQLIDAMVESAVKSELPGGLVVITCGWRESIRPRGLDLHSLNLALDFRANNLIVGRGRSRSEATWAWVARARDILGDSRFQFMAHGTGANWHIHGEWDPR